MSGGAWDRIALRSCTDAHKTFRYQLCKSMDTMKQHPETLPTRCFDSNTEHPTFGQGWDEWHRNPAKRIRIHRKRIPPCALRSLYSRDGIGQCCSNLRQLGDRFVDKCASRLRLVLCCQRCDVTTETVMDRVFQSVALKSGYDA